MPLRQMETDFLDPIRGSEGKGVAHPYLVQLIYKDFPFAS